MSLGHISVSITTMKLAKALSFRIVELEQPVVTLYQFSVILHQIYLSKAYRNEPIQSLKADSADVQALSHALASLIDDGILDPYRGFPKRSVYSILGRGDADPREVACSVDPFCYVSHLSAMEHHGLTNRMPSKLFLSSPGRNLWRNYALKRMRKDLGDTLDSYISNSLPELTKISVQKIGRTIVYRHASIHLGAYRNVRDKTLRVSTIGRTFLDMLRNPELCGGMAHVLEVYAEHARTYLKLIVDEIDNHGAPIDKVRAGYILDERLGLHHPTIDNWITHAQRGGSRKLDSSGEYSPEFSEKWCLSVNVFG